MTGPDGERLCSTCGEPNPVRAKFCLECGAKLEDDLAELGERRVLTVLFADLSGFTAFSEGSDVEDVRTLAQEAADRLGEIVARYGGTVDKIIGDCVMAVFGAPVAHEDDPERAVRAALDMQAVVSSQSEKFFGLALCVGVNTGEAIWSPVGPDGRYTALGDTVNTASRLQGAAKKGEILVGAETYERSDAAIDYEPVEPIKAKNKSEPVHAWKAVTAKDARKAAVDLPLIGRAAELDRIWELWQLVRTERKPYLATIVGAPGVGKSRVIRAALERIAGSAQILTGRALAFGDGITYWPVIEMVKSAAGIKHDDDTAEGSRKLGQLLEKLGSEDLDELRTMAVALANLIAAPTTPRGTFTATEITKGELHWGIRRVFQLLSRRAPLVLVFEDLHYAEASFIDLILSFLDAGDEAPIFVIAGGRPEVIEEKPQLVAAHKQVRTLNLEVLSSEESLSLLEAMLPGSADDESIRSVLSRAAGNPLFLEETVRMLNEAGAIDEEGNLVKEKIDAVAVPSSLRGLISARLDRLPDELKHLAGRGSIMGESFWSGAVAFMHGDEGDVDELLYELQDHDVVREAPTSTITGQREWTFRHALIRDVVYERIPKSERARLHERCAEWISFGGGDEYAEIIAHHLEQSCLLAQGMARSNFVPPVLDAVRALSRGGEKAQAHDGAREAVRFFERALNLLDGAFPETSTELRLRMARSLGALGRYDDAYAEMGRVAEECGEIGRLDMRGKALINRAELDIMMGRVSEARAQLTQAEEIASQLNDAGLHIRTRWQRAVLNEIYDASPSAAEENLRGSLALAEEIDDRELILTLQMRLGALLFNVGKLEAAERELASAAEVAAERGSLRHASWVTSFLGVVRTHRGPRAQAAQDLAQASEWLERTDDRYMRIQTLVWRANLELLEGDVRKAVLLLRTALPLARAIGGPLVALVCRSLVEALVRQDRVAEARELVETAKESAPEEDPYAQAYVRLAEAFINAADGDDAGVRQRCAIALPLLEGTQITLGEALIAEAQVLTMVGDTNGASDRLGRARAIFMDVGGDATVDAIDRELERLSAQRPISVVSRRRTSA